MPSDKVCEKLKKKDKQVKKNFESESKFEPIRKMLYLRERKSNPIRRKVLKQESKYNLIMKKFFKWDSKSKPIRKFFQTRKQIQPDYEKSLNEKANPSRLGKSL